MPHQDDRPLTPSDLRRRAEAQALERADLASEDLECMTVEARRQVIHELRVHQIELEMQNEELRRVQAELDAAREHFFDLYDLAPVGYITVSEEGLILEANLTAASLLGVTRDELVKQPFTRFIFKEDQDVYYLRRRMLDKVGGPLACELRMQGKNREAFWGQLQIASGWDSWAGLGQDAYRQPLMRIILSNIDERRQAEQDRRAIEAQLQQAQKMQGLGNLVAGVAHNINNVLAIIMGTASMQEETAATATDLEAYRNIGNACQRGREVVKSLLRFAQPSMSARAPFELQALCREVCNLLDNTSRSQVRIVQALTQEPLWINGDAGSINHVLVNLALNSLDAIAERGTLTFRTAVPEAGWVEVSVEDDGAGIPPDLLPHVMEPFFSTKEVGKGVGLGLSVTYGVVKAHGGTIEVASEVGKGSRFLVKLPSQPPKTGALSQSWIIPAAGMA